MTHPRRRIPRRPAIFVLTIIAALFWTSTAFGIDPPTISGANGDTFGLASPFLPTYGITGNLTGDTLNWTVVDQNNAVVASGIPTAAPSVSTGDIPGLPAGQYTLTAELTLSTSTDPAGVATRTFQVDGTPPAVPNVTQPLTPSNNANPLVTWSSEAGARYNYSLDGGPAVSTDTTANVPLAGLTSATHTISVQAIDAVGNASNFSTPATSFVVDTVAPTGGSWTHLPATNPLASALFTRTATINLTVTAAVDPLAITYAASAALAPAVPVAPATITGTTALSLPLPGQGSGLVNAYNVGVFARDAAGNVAALPTQTVTFDTQLPTLANVVGFSNPAPPPNPSSPVGLAANIQIAFSEPIQAPPASPSPFRLCLNACGVSVAGAPSVDTVNGRIIIDPTDPLAAGATYEIQLLNIRDRAGNGLAAPSWTFTTSTDGTPPGTVTGLTATSGVRQLLLQWIRPTDADLARITVLRSTTPPASAGDAAAARFSLPPTATTFTDVGLTPLVTYHYAVYAEDAVGNPSLLARTTGIAKAPLVPGSGLPLKPPKGYLDKLMKPRRAAVLGTLRPLLRWQARRGAVLYQIQIYDLITGKRVLKAFTKRTTYKVPAKRLKATHRYAWYVWHHVGIKARAAKNPMTSWFAMSSKARK